MRFHKTLPTEKLRLYIKQIAISENEDAQVYKVFPSPGMVIGFQYRGGLALVKDGQEDKLAAAGITGMGGGPSVFKNSAGIGTVLVYLTETGLAQFSSCPAHELFNQSVSLDNLFDKQLLLDLEERLGLAATDSERIRLVEAFLLSQLREKTRDQLIIQAVDLIYKAKGSIAMQELHTQLYISQSAFEKRFKKLVGATPKKFASIVRFNTVLQELGKERSLVDICYEHGFFDQAHFIHDFKLYTGERPEQYRKQL